MTDEFVIAAIFAACAGLGLTLAFCWLTLYTGARRLRREMRDLARTHGLACAERPYRASNGRMYRYDVALGRIVKA